MAISKSITVAIDIDEVIYNIIDHIIDSCLPKIEKGYQPKQWDCFDELGISRDEFFKYYSVCWFEASYNPSIALKYINSEAFKLIRELKSKGYRVSIITKRPRRDIPNTLTFLDNWNIPYDAFVNITDGQDKTKENFDVIIDDYPGNMPQNIDGKYGILLTKEWNKDFTGECVRVNSLSEVPFILKTFLSDPVIVK